MISPSLRRGENCTYCLANVRLPLISSFMILISVMLGAKSILLRVVEHGGDLQSDHDETPMITLIIRCFYVNWWVSSVSK